MTKKEIIKKLADLFLDKTIGEIYEKFENDDERTGAQLLISYQFRRAYPLIKELLNKGRKTKQRYEKIKSSTK